MRRGSGSTTASTGAGWTERTAADLASLIVELGRAVKSAAFYGCDDPATVTLIDRAHRAWQSDVARAGPLELTVSADSVATDELPDKVLISHMPELSRAFGSGRIERLRIGTSLSRASFLGLVAALERAENADSAGSLYALSGIEVNGVAATGPELTPPSRVRVPVPPTLQAVPATPLQAVPATPQPVLPATPRPVPATRAVTEPARRIAVSPAPDRTPPDPLDRAEPTPEPKPTQDGDPRTRTPANAREHALRETLAALDDCDHDDGYVTVSRRVVELTLELASARAFDAVHGAMLVLAEHASGGAARSEQQTRIARTTLLKLAVGTTLDELILRATSKDPTSSVRAAQALLVIGDGAVPAILDQLEAEPKAPHTAQLTGLLIALGERTLPALSAAIVGTNGRRARIAIHVAADLQAPGLVAPLREHLCRPGASPSDAARALVEIGNAAAVDALLDCVASEHLRVAELATRCLGTLAAPHSLSPLVERLHSAGRARAWGLVREVLASIGQFQACDPAAAERLKSWICQPRLGVSRPQLELRLEAVAVLGRLAGSSVDRTLRDIAKGKPPRAGKQIRERAQGILEQRAEFGRRARNVKSLQ